MELRAIELVEDRTAASRCDDGFLTLARLQLRNVYDDGTRSDVYPCDVVSRPGSDAVVAALYAVEPDGRVTAILREGTRPPIYLRRHKDFEHPDPREYLTLEEVVAGVVEPGDGGGNAGLRRRAALEAHEEAGIATPAERFRVIGGETFASPGTSDEKIFFCAGPADLAQARAPRGDGSVMEEWTRIVRRELGDAVEACRSGAIPDMKTEVALLRLADHLGFIPQLGCFAHELPPELRARYRRLGVAGVDAPP